jgi:nucleoside diphosphate kinase
MKGISEYIKESMQSYSKCFMVVKPGSLNLVPEILNRLSKSGWEVDRTIVKKLTLKEAEQLYLVHKKESFYEDLCNYMSSDISRGFIIKKRGLDKFQNINSFKDEIRDEFGESDMRNVIHSSDSYEAMMNEAPIYFGSL